MRDPERRVRFFFTEQVHLIGSGLIPFHPAGLQHRVTTFFIILFYIQKGGRGSVILIAASVVYGLLLLQNLPKGGLSAFYRLENRAVYSKRQDLAVSFGVGSNLSSWIGKLMFI